MRNYYFLILCLLSFGFLSAQEELSKEEKERRERNIQAGNPFAKFGYKAKVATLSKGKYLEVHDLDSIVTIGTTRWHVDKNKIVGDIVIDSLNPDARPIGDVAGRWISPDPLTEEYPDWSPYAFTANNPIRYVDPDGLEPIDPRTGKPISLNLNRAAVYDDNHIKNTKNKVVKDNDLFNNTNSKFLKRSRNSPDAQWQGASVHKHETNFEHTSTGAFNALKKLFPNNDNIDSSFDAPSDGIWNSVSKLGTYTFIDDRYAESEWLFMNQSSYNIFTVEENYITQVVNLSRSDVDNGEFNINSVTSFNIDKGDVQSRTVKTWWGGSKTEKYRTLNVTETTQSYKNNSPSGKSTSKTYTREEIIK